MVIDASETISDQDLKVLSMVEDAGKALVIAYNKWDLDRRGAPPLPEPGDRRTRAFAWAPSVNISALTGRGVEKLSAAIEQALEGRETRVSTGKLNAFLGRLAAAHPHPVRSGKQPRILFGTQAHNCPPIACATTSGRSTREYIRQAWSDGCARTSVSRARRCTSRCGRGRSARSGPEGSVGLLARPGRRRAPGEGFQPCCCGGCQPPGAGGVSG